jgi:hypothetical protein
LRTAWKQVQEQRGTLNAAGEKTDRAEDDERPHNGWTV